MKKSNVEKYIDSLPRSVRSIMNFFLGLLCIIVFFESPFLLFLGIFFIVIVIKTIFPDTPDRFFRLQTVLPTSRIRSMAKGLVEVKGHIQARETLKAPLDKTPCVAYRYLITDIYRDSDGNSKTRVLHDEEKYVDFALDDKTGIAYIDTSSGIELVKLDEHLTKHIGARTHTQYLLLNQTRVFVIGKAVPRSAMFGDEQLITKDEEHNILAVAPVSVVKSWEFYKPLRQSAVLFACIAAILIAFIFLMDFSLDSGQVIIELSKDSILSGLGFGGR